jgi:phosphatidate phosphatase APP1
VTAEPAGAARVHPASACEVRIKRAAAARLVARGWRPRVVPFTGYGAAGWVRVMARVLLAPPGTPRRPAGDSRGWRRFVPLTAGGIPVTVTVGETEHAVQSGTDGYLDVRLEAPVSPGWMEVQLTVGDAAPVSAPIRVVGPATTVGLVSDIDDTVIVTMLPRPLLAFRNAFLLRESDRQPVPGMAGLYADLATAHPDLFVVYLSTGAWNTAVALRGFLARHGYPAGPMLLTDWGPTPDGWFRSGNAHKQAQLRRLFDELPHVRWLLVGDDGQHDPQLYAETVSAFPDKVLAVAIRRLTLPQQVGHLVPALRRTPVSVELGDDVVSATDGEGLREGLRNRGLLTGSG